MAASPASTSPRNSARSCTASSARWMVSVSVAACRMCLARSIFAWSRMRFVRRSVAPARGPGRFVVVAMTVLDNWYLYNTINYLYRQGARPCGLRRATVSVRLVAMNIHHMHRTQLYLDRATHARLKAVAKRRGRTVSELVREALELVYGSGKTATRLATLWGIAGLWRHPRDLARPRACV